MELKDTKTLANLKAALAGESMARNKYTYFAQAARQEGLDKVADEFEAMAVNEMTHAKFWFELVHGKPGDVFANLKSAMQGELDEWKSMYPEFAKTAREEGLDDIAVMFDNVASIEKSHEERFMKLFMELKSAEAKKEGNSNKAEKSEEAAPKKKAEDEYRCVFCGATFSDRLDVCPVCKAIGAFDLVGTK